jgi:hypothetical protein
MCIITDFNKYINITEPGGKHAREKKIANLFPGS